ncbi:hypothetical protein EDD36DRAFT_2340 [Exophiala viscosa]|uniref:Uncharacterized protein n=1 Tax=Exophiala viscosa TaxID=2486360 RepID=A0AAN6IGR8_9EURO|nr:hypothetical protein EDD36DRAFT_2340 [Exophiala viscosa]
MPGLDSPLFGRMPGAQHAQLTPYLLSVLLVCNGYRILRRITNVRQQRWHGTWGRVVADYCIAVGGGTISGRLDGQRRDRSPTLVRRCVACQATHLFWLANIAAIVIIPCYHNIAGTMDHLRS